VPLHGVGLQGHIKGKYQIDGDGLYNFVAEIKALGLSVHVTELDVIDKDLPGPVSARDAVVASRAYDFLNSIFAATRPMAITTWGITIAIVCARLVQAQRRPGQPPAAFRRVLSAEAALVGDRLFLSKERLAGAGG
jgi:GH35 family endo-1,4-beta-xylanase